MDRIRTIGCAVDGAPASLKALDTAAALARALGAELVLIHVESGAEALFAPPLSGRRRSETEHAQLTAWEEQARELRGAPVRLELAWGPVGAEIVSFCRREACGMIVLGAKARTAAAFAVGSVAAHVVPHAPCPVLLVR